VTSRSTTEWAQCGWSSTELIFP